MGFDYFFLPKNLKGLIEKMVGLIRPAGLHLSTTGVGFQHGYQVLMTMSARKIVCRRLYVFDDGISVCAVHLPE